MALRLVVASLVALMALPAEPVHAQNYFQSLFGTGSPAPRSYGNSYRSPYVWPFASPFGAPYRGNDEGQTVDRAGTVRTLCVRLCDGFYFPISNATVRSELARDADKCSASCGVEARLFYHSNVGGDVESMVDLTGRAYAFLPNAFKYRKTLVQGCRCRPQPWSEAELQRHRAYAEGRPADVVASVPSVGEEASPAGDAPVSRRAEISLSGLEPIDRKTLEELDFVAPPRVAGTAETGVTILDGERSLPRPAPVARQAPQPSWFPTFGSSSRSPNSWPSDPRRSKY